LNKLSIYSIISIVTLAFMMLLMGLTLKNYGWFEDHHGLSLAERIRRDFIGNYDFSSTDVTIISRPLITISESKVDGGAEWLTISLDTLPRYQVRVNDFENSQVLLELYVFDSSGHEQRLEGCELLLIEEEPEHFRAQTIGEFCGLKEGSSEYLAMDLLLQPSSMSLQIQFRELEDQTLLKTKKYLLERIDSQ